MTETALGVLLIAALGAAQAKEMPTEASGESVRKAVQCIQWDVPM